MTSRRKALVNDMTKKKTGEAPIEQAKDAPEDLFFKGNPCSNEDCVSFQKVTFKADGTCDVPRVCHECCHLVKIDFYRPKE